MADQTTTQSRVSRSVKQTSASRVVKRSDVDRLFYGDLASEVWLLSTGYWSAGYWISGHYWE